MLKMYDEFASWWPILSPPEDYEEEASFFLELFERGGLPESPSLLELGCGGGSNASYLKAGFAHLTLCDLSPQMLAISRALNPECEHLEGDMRTIRLAREFDAVFIHDAIDYMTTLDDLRQAIETAFVHCKPGGMALFVPDNIRETFESFTEQDGQDGDGRAMRYIEWSYDPDETDTLYTTDYVYIFREDNKPVRIEHDQHICGLFPRADWLRLIEETGFEATSMQDAYLREVFIARKP